MSVRPLPTLSCLILIGALSACQPAAPSSTPTALPPAATSAPSATPSFTATQAPSPTFTASPTLTAVPATVTQPRASGGGGGGGPAPVPSATPGSIIILQPCTIGGGLDVYVYVIDRLYHIVDMDAFNNLGYSTSQIVDCGSASSAPKAGPLTRLIKGSGDPVYLMEGGKRRHIPDMATLAALGYKPEDITVLPDVVVGGWPLGAPLPSSSGSGGGSGGSGGTPGQQVQIGGYTISLVPQTQGVAGPYQGVITHPGQPDITIPDVEALGDLPAADVTGEGDPDVEFLTYTVGSSHCCRGTILYSLGAAPDKALDIISTPYYGDFTGRGTFKDLNGDGSYEFLTHDAMTGLPCTAPTVSAVLRFTSEGQYVGGAPAYPYAFSDEIDQLKASTQPGVICQIYPYIATIYTTGATELAQAEFDRLYTGPNHDSDWAALQSAVEHTRFYVARLVTAH